MAILTLNEVLAHCRLEPDYPLDQILPYMYAAESRVAEHLNVAVFEDEGSLSSAQDAMPALLGQAYDTYKTSIDAAGLIDNPAQRQAMLDLAQTRYDEAQKQARRVMNGIVANGTIIAAMLLTAGALFENRSSDVVGLSVAKLPTDAIELLRNLRLVQMP